MIISRRGKANQSITVQGWSDDSHQIVFAKGMTAFAKYIKAARPGTEQKNAARSEVFAKAGLATA